MVCNGGNRALQVTCVFRGLHRDASRKRGRRVALCCCMGFAACIQTIIMGFAIRDVCKSRSHLGSVRMEVAILAELSLDVRVREMRICRRFRTWVWPSVKLSPLLNVFAGCDVGIRAPAWAPCASTSPSSVREMPFCRPFWTSGFAGRKALVAFGRLGSPSSQLSVGVRQMRNCRPFWCFSSFPPPSD